MSNNVGLMDGIVFLAGAAISVGLLWLLRPMLQRHALAHPNCPLVAQRTDTAGRRLRGRSARP